MLFVFLLIRNMFDSLPRRRSVFSLFFTTFLLLLFFFSHGDGDDQVTTAIGAIIDLGSRTGQEEKTAMEFALENFNNNSNYHKLQLHFGDLGDQPLEAAFTAEEMITKNKVRVIIGMQTWEQAALVADITRPSQIPILSLASTSITPPLMNLRWPYLIKMAGDGLDQMKSIASIIRSYNWRRVIVIYEDDVYGGSSGKLHLLSQALQNNGSDIEFRLVLPPFSSLSNPNETIRLQLAKVLTDVQSRVFVLLKSSLPMVAHLFNQANSMGLVGKDSVWIITDTITDFLDSMNASVISSMKGALGIKTAYSKSSNLYKSLDVRFQQQGFRPGVHALRAYDSIMIVGEAVKKMTSDFNSQEVLLNSILSSNFTGLSGKINFTSGQLSDKPELKIVNIVGTNYKELEFWLPKLGFTSNGSKVINENGIASNSTAGGFQGRVRWPGDYDGTPKGWAMPSDAKKLKIVVPEKATLDKFVKTTKDKNGVVRYDGFSIKLFEEVVNNQLDYHLPYDFVAHPTGNYTQLVLDVQNKIYDGAVGDITILAERTRLVDFTQPYMESGLSMIVQVKQQSNWMFLKPFSFGMWMATIAVFVYTTLIIWLLEHRSNPEFGGTRKNQISTALWYTCSSLFFAQKENVKSSYTRVVVMAWFGVVFVITASYTASLSSLLTVNRLGRSFPNLLRLKVGSYDDTFVNDYLNKVLGIKTANIKKLTIDEDFKTQFDRNNIDAAFFELPYAKDFMNQNCKKYTTVTDNYRFGGLAFAFQKGSPVASDVSMAILKLSEQGTLRALQEEWFKAASGCSTNGTYTYINSLTIDSFWAIYLICTATSTLCVIIFITRLLIKFPRGQQVNEGGDGKSIFKLISRVASYIVSREESMSGRGDGTSGQAPIVNESKSSSSERLGVNSPGQLQMLQITRM